MTVTHLIVLRVREVLPYISVVISRTLDNNSGEDSYTLDIYT